MAKKRIPVTVIVVVLIISFSVIMRWTGQRDQEANRVRIVATNRTDALRGPPEHKVVREKEQQINDCDGWPGMSFRDKKAKYRADPERWARCLCEGEGCELDRIYLTGKVSR